jgi:hypothetical protein
MNPPLETTLRHVMLLAKAFTAWNVVFFAISLAAVGTIADDAVVAVLLRGAVFAAAGLLLVHLVGKMREGRRSSWLRLSFISVLAPLGIAAFVVFSPDLPLWFVAGQLGSALLLVGIASRILPQEVRGQFPKASAEPVAQDSLV